MAIQLDFNLHAVRVALGLSQERMARVMGVSAKTIERWEASDEPPASPVALGRLRSLREIVDLGRLVYTTRGFELFLKTPLREFGGRAAITLLELGEFDRVLGALARDYEGQWA